MSSYQYARRRESEHWDTREGFGRRQTDDFSFSATPRKTPTGTVVKAAMAMYQPPPPTKSVVLEKKSGPTLKNFERGIFGQIQPTGIQSRAQLEATSPWATTTITVPDDEVKVGPHLLKKRSGTGNGDRTQASSPQLREVAGAVVDAGQVAARYIRDDVPDIDPDEVADQGTVQGSSTENTSQWFADRELLSQHTASLKQHASLLQPTSPHQRRRSEIEQRCVPLRTSRQHKQQLDPASVLQKIKVLLIGHRSHVESTINTLQKSLAQLAEISKLSKQLADFHLDACRSATAASSEMNRPNIEDPPSMIRRRTRSMPDVLDLVDSAAKSLGVNLIAASRPPLDTISSAGSERGTSPVPSIQDAANAFSESESSRCRDYSRFSTEYEQLPSRTPTNGHPYRPPERDYNYDDSDYEAEGSSNYSNNDGQSWRPSPPPCYQDLSFEDAVVFPRYNIRHLNIHRSTEESETPSQSPPVLFSTPPEPDASAPSNKSSPPLSPSIRTTLAPIASKPPQHIPFLLHSISSLDDLQVTKLGRVPDNYLTTGQPRPPPPSNVHTPGMWTPRVPTPPAGTPRLWSPHPIAPAVSSEAIYENVTARKTPSPPPSTPTRPTLQPLHDRRASSSLPSSPVPSPPSPVTPLPSTPLYNATSRSEPTTPLACGEGAFVPCRSQTPVPTPAPPSLELRRKMSNHVYRNARPYTPLQRTARSDSPTNVDGEDGNGHSHMDMVDGNIEDATKLLSDFIPGQPSNRHTQVPASASSIRNRFSASSFSSSFSNSSTNHPFPPTSPPPPPRQFIRATLTNSPFVLDQSALAASDTSLHPTPSFTGMQSPLLLDPAEIPLFFAQVLQDGSVDSAPSTAELDRKSEKTAGVRF